MLTLCAEDQQNMVKPYEFVDVSHGRFHTSNSPISKEGPPTRDVRWVGRVKWVVRGQAE